MKKIVTVVFAALFALSSASVFAASHAKAADDKKGGEMKKDAKKGEMKKDDKKDAKKDDKKK